MTLRSSLVLLSTSLALGCGGASPPAQATVASPSENGVASPAREGFCRFDEPEVSVPPVHEPPAAAAAAYARGVAATESGDFEAARVAYEEALRVDPAYAIAAYNLGVTFTRIHRDTEAIAAFERAAALEPTLADALYNLGLLRYATGDFAGALDAWRRTRTLAPRELEVTKKIVQALNALERFDEAETERREVRRIRSCSDDADIRAMTAFVIDQLTVDDERVLVYEVFEPDPEWTVYYSFRVVANDAVVRAVQLESDPVTRESGYAALFGVAFPDESHLTTRIGYRDLPRYDAIRATAIDLVRDSRSIRPAR